MSKRLVKIPMFATANDTDKWALCVDGRFGLFDTKADAEKLYLSAVPEQEHIDNTAFGSICLIPPGYRPTNGLAKVLGEPEDMTKALVSNFKAIDIAGYIRKQRDKQYCACDPLVLRQAGQFCSYARKNILPFKNDFFI